MTYRHSEVDTVAGQPLSRSEFADAIHRAADGNPHGGNPSALRRLTSTSVFWLTTSACSADQELEGLMGRFGRHIVMTVD